MSDGNKRKGLSSFMEKFIISILGTTISIALTFGTTALINNHKKKIAKRCPQSSWRRPSMTSCAC